jgi:methylated-DNA-protein-cysteine methyltransferase-like protein
MTQQKPAGDFFDMVYQVVRLIPRGRVSTYGAIARYLGTARSARMVGWALNSCGSVRPKVPAHRVVNRSGMLSGQHHFDEPGLMQKLLEKEGITVHENCVQQFVLLFWDPSKELEI